MAFTTISSANSLAVKRWETETWLQAMRTTVFGHMFNRGSVFYPSELVGTPTKPGDSVTFGYAGKLTKVPVGEGGTMDGNEEALDLRGYNMIMNIQRMAILNPNVDTIEQARTYVKFDEVSKQMLSRRAAEILDTSVMYQLAGASPTSLTIDGTTYSNASALLQVQGQNQITAPTANRIVRAGNVANDQSITSAMKMTLDLIDVAIESASLTNQPIEALDDNTWDLYCSPEQIYDLMHDSSGKIQWYLNAQSKAAGGDASDLEQGFKNNIASIGMYHGVNIYQSPRVAYGVNSSTSAVITTVRRAVLVGRNAIAFASPYGGRITDNDVPVKFFAQFKDYDYWKGLEARLIYGARKLVPTGGDDIGVIVIATYAAPHSAITY